MVSCLLTITFSWGRRGKGWVEVTITEVLHAAHYRHSLWRLRAAVESRWILLVQTSLPLIVQTKLFDNSRETLKKKHYHKLRTSVISMRHRTNVGSMSGQRRNTIPANTKHLLTVYTTSAKRLLTLEQHCKNVIQMFCVYWDQGYYNSHITSGCK